MTSNSKENHSMSNSKKKVLVLGGSGLLGSHCVKYFKKKFDLYWTFTGKEKKILDKKSFYLKYPDKENLINCLDKINPNIIINCIGFVSVDESEKNEKLAHELNVNIIKDIIKKLNSKNNQKTFFVQISSGGVYGNHLNQKNKPWLEKDVLRPLSKYAKSKQEGENATKNYIGPYLILRTDFYGINLFKKKRTLLSWIITNAKYKEQIIGWENIYFSPISAYKLCETLDKLLTKKVTGIFNIGSNKGCNKFEFVEKTCEYLNLIPNLSKEKVKSTIRPYYSILSTKKIEKQIDFKCDWKNDLNEYLKSIDKKLISNL